MDAGTTCTQSSCTQRSDYRHTSAGNAPGFEAPSPPRPCHSRLHAAKEWCYAATTTATATTAGAADYGAKDDPFSFAGTSSTREPLLWIAVASQQWAAHASGHLLQPSRYAAITSQDGQSYTQGYLSEPVPSYSAARWDGSAYAFSGLAAQPFHQTTLSDRSGQASGHAKNFGRTQRRWAVYVA